MKNNPRIAVPPASCAKGSPETFVRIEGDGALFGVALRILPIGKCVNAVYLMPSEYTTILCAGGVLVHGRRYNGSEGSELSWLR